jgi:hypothetical protein
MMIPEVQNTVNAQGGGFGPPPGGGYGAPPGGGYGQPGGYGPPPGAPGGVPPMAPPGGGYGAPPPGPVGGGDPALEKSLGTWFILSILAFFCGCSCLAAVPVYLVHTGKQAYAAGDYAGAKSKLKIAKICVILGWVFAVLGILSYAAFFLFAMMNGATTSSY